MLYFLFRSHRIVRFTHVMLHKGAIPAWGDTRGSWSLALGKLDYPGRKPGGLSQLLTEPHRPGKGKQKNWVLSWEHI